MTTADAQRYWRIALADHQEARRMWQLSGFRGSSIGFLLQQAAEKAFKAWIHLAGGVSPFTHDLSALIDLLHHLGEDCSAYAELTDLSFFAVQLRYDDVLELEELPWPALIALVQALLGEVERRFPRA